MHSFRSIKNTLQISRTRIPQNKIRFIPRIIVNTIFTPFPPRIIMSRSEAISKATALQRAALRYRFRQIHKENVALLWFSTGANSPTVYLRPDIYKKRKETSNKQFSGDFSGGERPKSCQVREIRGRSSLSIFEFLLGPRFTLHSYNEKKRVTRGSCLTKEGG